MSSGRLLLFEDEWAPSFEPLALSRSTARLRLGAWTHAERWERLLASRMLALLCRGALADVERESGVWNEVLAGGALPGGARSGGADPDTLFVAAVLGRPAPALFDRIAGLAAGRALVARGRLVAARAAGERAARLAGALAERAGDEAIRYDAFPEGAGAAGGEPGNPLPLEGLGFVVEEVEVSLPSTLADLVADAADSITADFALYEPILRAPVPGDFPGVHFVRPERIRLGEDVLVDPGVVLDARDGPILVGPGTRILANAVLVGPVVLGPRCLVKPGAKLLHGVSAGPTCKVGGEIEASILQGFANKQHDGFLGHSVLGEWVNLGAATDTSDLKNNYGEVRMTIAGAERRTGSRHLGSFFGDHAKTGIHTQLNTGTVVGAFANLFGGGIPPKEIPSFAWGGEGRWEEYRFEKAVETGAVVMSRRQENLTPAARSLAARLFDETAPRRRAWLSQFARSR